MLHMLLIVSADLDRVRGSHIEGQAVDARVGEFGHRSYSSSCRKHLASLCCKFPDSKTGEISAIHERNFLSFKRHGLSFNSQECDGICK